MLRNIIRGKLNCHFQDLLPVFNGKYSTTCYLDETLHALNDMARRMGASRPTITASSRRSSCIGLYHRMPEQSFAMSLSLRLGAGRPPRPRRARAAVRARQDARRQRSRGNALAAEHPAARQGRQHRRRRVPLSIQLLKEFRGGKEFGALVAAKMSLGAEPMKDIGNVYCAALPAWMAAGLEDAYQRGVDLAGRKLLAVGYGSGDAAEADSDDRRA